MKLNWLLGGNIIYAITQWIVLVILTRFFSTQELGLYFFSLSLVAPLALLFSLKLPNLVVTLDESLTNERNILFFRNLLSLLLCFVSFIFYFLFFQSNTTLLILSSVLIYKILEQNDEVTIAYFQKKLNFRDIFLVKAIRSCVYLFFIIIFCLYFKNIDFALVFATISYLLFWIYRNRKYFFISSFNDERKYISYYLKNGFMLSVSASISSLNVSGVRLYIGYVLGSTSLAVYGVISYSLVVFSIVVAALGQYFLPFFVNNKNNSKIFKENILKSQYIIIVIGLTCILISWIFGDFLLQLFYGSQYSEYSNYLFLIFIANIFKSSSALIGTAMTALRVYNFQLKFTIISFILTIVILPILISSFDMLGAFLGLIIVSFIEWILYMLFARKIFLEHVK